VAHLKPVSQITDRAKRMRANRVHKLRKRCEECGSRKNLGVGHRDGDESNNRPSNLFTQCKSCNGKQAARDIKAGRGVRTRQYNPNGLVKGERYFVKIAWRGAPTELVPVRTPEEASDIFQQTRDQFGFGSSDMKPGAGDIVTSSGKVVGRISYNGRIWPLGSDPWAKNPRKRLYKKARRNPGATNLAQYVQAAVEHTRGAHDEGGRVIHETPKSKRKEFAREIAFRKGHRNPRGKRRNPDASPADSLYRKFHGRGPDKIYEMQVAGIDPYGGHPELASLGPLIRFIVGEGVVLGGEYGDEVQEADWVREISFVPSVARWHEWLERADPPVSEAKAKLREWKVPDLAQVPAEGKKRGQLYIVGGSYDADAAELGVDPEKDLWDLGNVYLVEYFTQKSFDHFEPINYFHHFSEKSKREWPRLIYNKPSRFLSLAGGDYSVTPRGIEN
jgi:hypothetical protein